VLTNNDQPACEAVARPDMGGLRLAPVTEGGAARAIRPKHRPRVVVAQTANTQRLF
jgi:hypothetical protein